jgi:hypothetical protein
MTPRRRLAPFEDRRARNRRTFHATVTAVREAACTGERRSLCAGTPRHRCLCLDSIAQLRLLGRIAAP